ncbi:molybdenum cofactor synthesis domain protein [Thermogladius calderae 1633]|uniref:molybdopterin molybdotransferase n=1 Tax=Thermogladius calderae (strain DSM 22663 / VKM B-2946 / 1633) TaxID=1184251 RepID=I3TG87_THEC1|nr:molybdopterin biosynthesis protein [Thermogladius calderae]AFK51775.1 molybdenum cofactor synthesis domain protein [Thermogladius calderae 1633]
MSRKLFHSLVGLEEAFRIISSYYRLEPLGVEKVPLGEALFRVLAQDVYSPVDYPPFDRSEVDGYAVRSLDTSWADELSPVKLKIKGRVEVGEIPSLSVEEGEAVEVATGAMVPKGADAVVMEEHAKAGDNELTVYRSVYPGENISTTGSDVSIGDLVLQKGVVLTPERIGLLAGLGIREVVVYKKPRVAVFSTGREVVPPGSPLLPGQVYDVNSYLAVSFLNSIGASAVNLGILPDDERTIREEVSKAVEGFDLVLTSGGTSAGVRDVVYRVFDELGEPGVIIHGLRIKPGKPTVVAVARGKLLVGLPGFPLSCYIVLQKLVKPIIYKLAGLSSPEQEVVKAVLPVKIRKRAGFTMFVPVGLVSSDKGFTAYPLQSSSGSISSLVYSDGFVTIGENVELVDENELVEVELVKSYKPSARLVVIGSNDPLLYRVISELGLADKAKIIPVGSMGGWHAVARGEADIAPTHLLDEETGLYNTPYLEKTGLKGKAVIVKGYKRLIGLVFPKGNPKNIRGIEDFLRSDVRIVNRNRGSGVRGFLDIELKKLSARLGIGFEDLVKKINGYFYEVRTHTAVAAAVKHGRADVGIAVGWAAMMYDLDFKPLGWEEFDFLVSVDKLGGGEVARFVNALRDREFIKRVASEFKPYYQVTDATGSVVY